MQRVSFLKLITGAVTFSAISFVSFTNRVIKYLEKGFKVISGKDRFDQPQVLMEGDTFYTKVSGKDTGGANYIYESYRVKKGGPALHKHYSQDEWWYVLEGEFLIKVGETTYQAKAGDSVFGPRGVPHTFAKVSEGNARVLISFQPAGKMEEYFLAASKGELGQMTEQQQNEFRINHGFERVGPAINHLKQ